MGTVTGETSLLLFSLATVGAAVVGLGTQYVLLALTTLLIIPQVMFVDQGGFSDFVLVYAPTSLLYLLSSEHWRTFSYAGTVQLLLVWWQTTSSFHGLVFGLAANIGVYTVLERLLVDRWMLSDSYKKSNTLHWELFDNCNEGTLIVDLDGTVKYYNKAVYRFIESRSPLRNLNVSNLLPKHLEITKTLKGCARGQAYQTVVNLTNNPLEAINSSAVVISYKLIAVAANWVGGNCIRITLQDETTNAKQYAMTQITLKDLQNSCSILDREIERCLKSEEAPRREDLLRLNWLSFNVYSTSCWQMVCQGSIELKQRLFDIRNEVIGVIENSISKHLDKLEDVMLVFDTSFPYGVIGDPDLHSHLLKALLMFALQHATPESAFKIYCNVSV